VKPTLATWRLDRLGFFTVYRRFWFLQAASLGPVTELLQNIFPVSKPLSGQNPADGTPAGYSLSGK
jgi:hypothetical protein